VPNQYIENGEIKYEKILIDVILPYFQEVGRILQIGDIFFAGNVEFKVHGCIPFSGRLSVHSEIHFYE